MLWLCSRHGERMDRVGGKCDDLQYASVRAAGVDGFAVSPVSGSSRPSAAATRPSTVSRCAITPATVVRRLVGPTPSNHRSRTGACHSASPMSWSSASSRAVSASYGVPHSGTGMRGGRRSKDPVRTRVRSPGSRSSGSTGCSRPTAPRSRSASSAQAPHSPRCSSTATVSSAEHAASAHAPSSAFSTRCSSTSGTGREAAASRSGSGRPLSSTEARGIGMRAGSPSPAPLAAPLFAEPPPPGPPASPREPSPLPEPPEPPLPPGPPRVPSPSSFTEPPFPEPSFTGRPCSGPPGLPDPPAPPCAGTTPSPSPNPSYSSRLSCPL